MSGKMHTTETDRVIEQQLRNWELSRAQQLSEVRVSPLVEPAAAGRAGRATTAGGSKGVRAVRGPRMMRFVTISRQMGAGGTEIARRLAERTSWALFDHEILESMAGDDRVRQRIYERLDEHDADWLGAMVENLVQGRMPADDYFPRLTRTILGIARGGSAIFLGRAADLILPREDGLRVRVVAPLEQRVERVAGRTHLDVAEARAEVERVDRQRIEFVRRHFRCDAECATRVDMIINTAAVTVEEAVEALVVIMRKRGMLT